MEWGWGGEVHDTAEMEDNVVLTRTGDVLQMEEDTQPTSSNIDTSNINMEEVTVIVNAEEEGNSIVSKIVCMENMEKKSESPVNTVTGKDLYGMMVDYNPIGVEACMYNVNKDEEMNVDIQNTSSMQDNVCYDNRNTTPVSGRGFVNVQRSVDQEEYTDRPVGIMNIVSMKQLTIFDTWGVPTSARLGNYNLGLSFTTPRKPGIRNTKAKTSTFKKSKIKTISKNSQSNYLKYFGKHLENNKGANKRESTQIGDSIVTPNTNGGGVGGGSDYTGFGK